MPHLFLSEIDRATPRRMAGVVGGGYESDWCYPCTDYFTPNASDPRGVSGLQDASHKVAGDDSAFIVDTFQDFLERQVAAASPFYAHICFHSIHEPHPAMPEFYHLYSKDPDYLGTLTQMDVQFGRLLGMLEQHKLMNDTVILYTADNVRVTYCLEHDQCCLRSCVHDISCVQDDTADNVIMSRVHIKEQSAPTSDGRLCSCASAKRQFLKVCTQGF
jgi:hypothetical protein